MGTTRHLTNVKKMLERYNREHEINIGELDAQSKKEGQWWNWSEVPFESAKLPILPKGKWDYLVKRYKPKVETLEYSTKKLFDPASNEFIPIIGDDDPREGVMSRSENI